ncbi:hypothetical protein D7V77_31725 [Corallococcus sp. CA041A]|nr:hypothetical protein D7V77_31725 [Corallococcus sp. CA041A]
MQVQPLAQEVLEASVAVRAVVVGSPGGRACELGREAFQVRDDGLHRAQLRQHVVGVEDGTHVREHLLAQLRRACLLRWRRSARCWGRCSSQVL